MHSNSHQPLPHSWIYEIILYRPIGTVAGNFIDIIYMMAQKCDNYKLMILLKYIHIYHTEAHCTDY